VQADQKPSENNQAARGQARRRFFYVQKDVQRHPASISRDILPSRVGDILPSRERDILPPALLTVCLVAIG